MEGIGSSKIIKCKQLKWVLLSISFLMIGSCTHTPNVIENIAGKNYITYTSRCASCPSDPICAIVDDIVVTAGTTFSVCSVIPAGEGTIQINSSNCLIWTSNSNHTDIIKTCIIACTNGVCDTTEVSILPPVPGDSTGEFNSCSPDSVYFERDILEVITSSCAYTGCHNSASAAEGIRLDNYANIIKYGKIKAGKPADSDLYKVVTTTSSKSVMPPPPAARLSSTQISNIEKWITQGAKNNNCINSVSDCNSKDISFNSFVKPALASCVSCHRTGNTGGGINLDSYQGIKSAAQSGSILGSISWLPGFIQMPQGGSKLSDCTIQKVKTWIESGSPNN